MSGVAPGHELFLRGDLGGYNGVTFSGVIGYRVLCVDYEKNEGRQR